MRISVRLALCVLGPALPLAAQSACGVTALGDAAKTVEAVRHNLHEQGVAEQDPVVPPAIAGQMGELKDALTKAADAALSCAPPGSDPEGLQKTLADALHANRTSAEESTTERKTKKDVGTYGADLAVQVFQLSSTPRFFEVNFRYGIECGDDNLLLVYEAGGDAGVPGWRQRLRWDAPSYHTVGDAMGDFVMLTPLTGDLHHPIWRFAVAHGHSSCEELPRPARFEIDLLKPTNDPAKPTVEWHFEHAYTQTNTTVPRLATTEDTLDFRILPSAPESSRPAAPVRGAEIYRFRLTGDGHMEPLPVSASPDSAGGGAGSTPARTNSPQ